MIVKDIAEDLNERIENIQKKILSGEVKLLDLELVPFFDELKDSLTVKNLEKSSETYKNACLLLNQKFDELRSMLSSLESEKHLFYFSYIFKLLQYFLFPSSSLQQHWIQLVFSISQNISA